MTAALMAGRRASVRKHKGAAKAAPKRKADASLVKRWREPADDGEGTRRDALLRALDELRDGGGVTVWSANSSTLKRASFGLNRRRKRW